jgi:DNA-binding transcriptional ArsR family regulator
VPARTVRCLPRVDSLDGGGSLAGTLGDPGGPNRARLLRAVDERPRNANQLAEALDLDYKTVRHHLEVLEENGVVRSSDYDYGAVYLPDGPGETALGDGRGGVRGDAGGGRVTRVRRAEDARRYLSGNGRLPPTEG